jgi:3-hydroxybutyrate dehydrogenase
MLNGFGEAAEINQIRKNIEQSFGIKTFYSPADMSKPGDIKGMVC